MSVEEAQSEADHVLRLIKGRHLTYPVFYDLEDAKYTGKCSHKLIGDMAETFCNAIERAGYKVGIYANKNWFTNILTDERFKKWMKWVAQYNTKCTYAGDYVMWQYSSKGSVHGISTAVDMNYCYKDFTSSAPVNVDPLASKSDEELADMVIRGLTMGVIELDKKIENFDDSQFLIDTVMGFLLVKGENLELIKLDTLQGTISIKGLINSLNYLDDSSKKEKDNSIFNRLFK
jgi:sporulation protein YabP